MSTQIVTNLKAIAAGLLFCIAPTASIHAEITIDISKITCKEFLPSHQFVAGQHRLLDQRLFQGKRGNTVSPSPVCRITSPRWRTSASVIVK